MENDIKNNYIKVFLLGLLIATLMVIAFIIKGEGILYIGDDYNLEFINFNEILNKSIKSGNIWWNSWDELGNSVFTGYAWNSTLPSFFLLLLFPPSFTPYLMGLILIIRYALATLFAYMYIKTYVKSYESALIGAIMYAFSGFQITNMLFYSFQDIVTFFPLLLLGLDGAMKKDKKNIFLVAVLINCFKYYYFFIAEGIFLVIYFVIKVITKDYVLTKKKFKKLCIETFLGISINGVILFIGVNSLLGNPRARESYFSVSGLFTSYDSLQQMMFNMIRTIKAFIMPPEVMHLQSLMSFNNFNSTEAFLPLFGVVLVLAYIIKKKKDWISILILVCVLISLNEVSNSIFYFFNATYYTRWFYMLILIMALASAKALDEKVEIYRGVCACVIIWIIFVISLFVYKVVGKDVQLVYNHNLLIYYIILMGIGMIVSIILLSKRESKYFYQCTVFSISVFAIITGVGNLYINQSLYPPSEKFKQMYTDSQEYINLPIGDNYRLDTLGCYRNVNIIWEKSSIYGFNDLVPSSVFEFNDALGLEKIGTSFPYYQYYGLRPFLSVQYVVEMTERPGNLCWLEFGKPNEILPHLEYYDTQGYYTIWENKDFIPMGYTYDYYVPEEYAVQIPKEYRHLTLLKGMVLSDEQVQKYKDIIAPIPSEKLVDVGQEAYENDVLERNKIVCSNFEYNKDGFAATITLDTPNLVFLSVPYDKGWRAEINGEPIEIEKVNYGFMAVKGEAGMNEIKFIFRPYGLKVGAIVSLVGIILTGVYIGMNRWKKNK